MLLKNQRSWCPLFGWTVSSLPALQEERSPHTPNNLVDIQAKLAAVNEEKMRGEDVTTLQQEENVSISGSNARLMIMKKLSRKQEVTRGCGFADVT